MHPMLGEDRVLDDRYSHAYTCNPDARFVEAVATDVCILHVI